MRLSTRLLLLLSLIITASATELTSRLRFDPDDLRLRAAPDGVIPQLKGCGPGPVPVGAPDLPVAVVQFLLPHDWGEPQLDWDSVEVEAMRGVQIQPRQPAVRPGAALPAPVPADPQAYAAAAVRPLAELALVQRVRGRRIAVVHIHPLRYDHGQASLALATEVTVRLQDSAMRVEAAANAPARPLTTGDRQILAGILPAVANPEDLESEDDRQTESTTVQSVTDGENDRVDYLIITNDELAPSFDRLAARRSQTHGFSTAVISVDDIALEYNGDDLQDKIRACITKYYTDHDAWMVVLGGCDQVVPDRNCYVTTYTDIEKKMPTDLYYSCLDGSWDDDGDKVYGEAGDDTVDMGYEVIVGRIPVNTAAQANAYIDKLIAVEDNPPADIHDKFLMGGASLGMASWDGGTGLASDQNVEEADGHVSLYARPGDIYDDEAWSRRIYRNWVWGSGYQPETTACFFSSLTSWDESVPGDYAVSDTNMITRFNENWNQVWWFTHGDYSSWAAGGGFSSSDALSVSGHVNIIATAACMTAGFDKAEPCLSEAFLRNPDGGAVVYVGSSRYGLGDGYASGYGGPSGHYGGVLYLSLLGSSTRLVGPAFAAHKRALSGNCTSNGPYRWLQFGINLQGDPAYRLRLQDTAPLQVTTPSTLPTADAGEAYSQQLTASGGASPYHWTIEGGSYTEEAIASSWIDPGGAQGWRADDGSHELDLPFAFPFYNIPYDSVIVTTNGSINFARKAYTGSVSAGEFLSTMCIAPLWNDLSTDQADHHDVYINASAERVAITWKGCPHGASGTELVFQAVLYPDGTIDCNYKDADGLAAAVGLSLGDGRTYSAGALWGDPAIPADCSYRYTYDHNLPAGWSFSADGVLSGNPSATGSLSLTALVTDSSAYPDWARRSFTLIIDDPGNEPPAVAAAASADPTVVAATTTTLSCLGEDDGGEAALRYTWSASGPADAAFDQSNGTNAGKSCSATLSAAGSYSFTCTISDTSARAVQTTVDVEVIATPAEVVIAPQATEILSGTSTSFAATVNDQFGDPLVTQPQVDWAVSGGGTIDSTGAFTADTTATGTHTVSASHAELTGTATVTIITGPPPPWIAQDIGAVGADGHTTYAHATATFTLTGSGADIWNGSDEFHFLHRPWRGDGTLSARLASLESTHDWAKAGVLIRSSTAADGSFAMMALTPGNGATFQYRTSAGDDAASSKESGWSAPAWVRLRRDGDLFTGSVSGDGITWTEVDSIEIPMGEAVDIGIGVTSHNDGVLCEAVFEEVSLRDERRVDLRIEAGGVPQLSTITASQRDSIHYYAELIEHAVRGLQDDADVVIGFGAPGGEG